MQQQQLYDLLGELDAGIYIQKVSRALADTALGAVTTGKAGKVVLTLDVKQIGSSNQVMVKHAVKMVKPTANGRTTDENLTETPVYVGVGGKLSALPDKQETLPGMTKTKE